MKSRCDMFTELKWNPADKIKLLRMDGIIKQINLFDCFFIQIKVWNVRILSVEWLPILAWINNHEKSGFVSVSDWLNIKIIEDKCRFVEHKPHCFVTTTTDCHTHTKIEGVLKRGYRWQVNQGWLRPAFCFGKHLSLHSHTQLLAKSHFHFCFVDLEPLGALSSYHKGVSSG